MSRYHDQDGGDVGGRVREEREKGCAEVSYITLHPQDFTSSQFQTTYDFVINSFLLKGKHESLSYIGHLKTFTDLLHKMKSICSEELKIGIPVLPTRFTHRLLMLPVPQAYSISVALPSSLGALGRKAFILHRNLVKVT